MNNSQLLLGLGGLSLAMTGAGFWLLRAVARQDLRESRIDAVRRGTIGPQAAVANQSLLFRLLGRGRSAAVPQWLAAGGDAD